MSGAQWTVVEQEGREPKKLVLCLGRLIVTLKRYPDGRWTADCVRTITPTFQTVILLGTYLNSRNVENAKVEGLKLVQQQLWDALCEFFEDEP